MSNVLPFPESRPIFWKEGLSYVYEPRVEGRPLGVRFRVERLKLSDEHLWAWLTVTCQLPGMPAELLGPQRHNFLASRSSLVGELDRSYGHEDIPADLWRQCIQRLTRELLGALRGRVQIKTLGPQELPEAPLDLVEKLIQAGQQTVLFGPGDTGKGWLGVALGLCVQEGIDFCGLAVRQARVLYLDWEADEETFLRRVKAVGAGLGIANPHLDWAEMTGTLSSQAEELAGLCDQRDVGLLVWDSVGRASAPIGERGSYEDSAKSFQDAISLVGRHRSHLLIDHVSGEGLGKKLAGRPINSIRKYNDARVAWEARKEQQEESTTQTVGLYHQKGNNTMRFSPLAVRMRFTSDPYGRATRVELSRTDMRAEPGLVSRLSHPKQVLALLRRGRMTTREVADALEVTLQRAGNLLREEQEKCTVVQIEAGQRGRGHPATWGLAAAEENAPRLRKYPRSFSSSGGFSAPPEEMNGPKHTEMNGGAFSGPGRFPGDRNQDPDPWSTDAPENGEVVFE